LLNFAIVNPRFPHPQGYRNVQKVAPDSLSIGAAKPQEGITSQKIASCAYGTR